MPAQRIDRPVRETRLDALLWFLAPALALCVIPVGFVSNDGLGHSAQFAAGAWRLNPNHLLFEPLGSWWLDLCARLGCGRAPVDQLKLLSALAGALAAALFRSVVAPRLAASRAVANLATAGFALSSAFLRLWVSDEHHMIQMPLVVAVWWAALRAAERPSWSRAVVVGATVGGAALAFISNLVLGAAVALALAVQCAARRQWRLAILNAIGVAVGALLVAGPLLIAAWWGSRESGSWLSWISSYGGARGSVPGAEAYGLVVSGRGFAEAGARALYGGSSALVDLTPLGAALRDRQAPGLLAIAGALAFVAAAAAMLVGVATLVRNARRGRGDGASLLVGGAWVCGILGFGFLWNNSDDQFFFQLAPVFGTLAAAGASSSRPRHLAAAVVGIGALCCWNLADVTGRRILYPREPRQALLTGSVAEACLVIVPGFDEPELLLRLSPSGSPPVLALTQLASAHSVDDGLRLLTSEIDRCLAAGRRVAVVDVYDFPPERAPWKFLRRLGYDHPQVERALADFPVDRGSLPVGPFRLRWVGTPRAPSAGKAAESGAALR